jgi:hypothetical protein
MLHRVLQHPFALSLSKRISNATQRINAYYYPI